MHYSLACHLIELGHLQMPFAHKAYYYKSTAPLRLKNTGVISNFPIHIHCQNDVALQSISNYFIVLLWLFWTF